MAVVDVLQILKPTLPAQVQVDTQFQEDLPRIIGDLGKLEQVITNLCLNADDAMPKGGRLGVETGTVYLDREFCRAQESLCPGKFVRVNVSDTGVGISEDDLAQIFEPFYTTKGGQGGTDMGLSLVYRIVREHGGIVQVDSTLGLGSEFTRHSPDRTTFPGYSSRRDGANYNLAFQGRQMCPDSLKFLLSWTNHRPAKRKISKPLVYDQVSSLGSPFALYDPVTVINPDAPKVD